MAGFTFKKATKKQAKARVGISGPAGAGKTYTALRLATAMCERVAVIDTEHGSASKYADEFDFDVLELDDFHPTNYVQAIRAAEAAGYDGLVIDSISHEWSGKNGCLELVEMYAKRNKGGNKFAAWGDVTPLHNEFIEAIHSAQLHIFATMRSKMDYIQTQDDKGRTKIEKVGMAPITRDGVEYEFDIVGEMDLEHTLVITKSRCKRLADRVIRFPGEELAKEIKAWLSDGAPEAAQHGKAATMEPPKAEQPSQTNVTTNQAEQPSVSNGSSRGVSGAYFAIATKVLNVDTDTAKEYAKKFASEFMKRDIASFNDIPPAVLKEAIKHIESGSPKTLYEEVQALRVAAAQPDPVPGYEQEALV